jgi:two-component system nitrogen regulation response regulator GlnG/two-component system response regulator HydG
VFLAPRAEHVLILGASGTGKELVARALHRRSARGERPLVSRNAATFPESLVAAELYGNAKNFPNPGMSDRIGLIGEADGSTLFLDEFAELPAAVQAQLLRVLDAGEYQRLGESHNRRSDFRLVAATNRPIEALRPDIAARFTFRIEVPDLNARREDIPLLVRHILRGIAEQDPDAAQRVFAGRGPNAAPVIPCELMRSLLQYDYSTHVRELRGRLWQALVSKVTGSTPAAPMARTTSSNPPSGYPARRSTPPPSRASTSPLGRRSAPPPARYSAPPPSRRSVPPPSSRGHHEGDLTAADIQACLDRHNGVQTHAWRELGLSSRHALARLIVKHGLVVRRHSRRARRSDTRSGRAK